MGFSSFLDNWIFSRMGSDPGTSREKLAGFQIKALNQTLAYVKQHSRFYRNRLSGKVPKEILNIKELAALPFTTPAHIQDDPAGFLCRSQDEISRIITLNTSGTTASAKRLFFTARDLEHTVDFFSQILCRIMDPGDTGIILLPGSTPGSAGDLIKTAMERVHAKGVVLGILQDFNRALNLISKRNPCLIIGMPTQVLALCEHGKNREKALSVPNVILTADHLPKPVVQRIKDILGCRVLNHYGMTETGFGGAIQCPAQDGLHIRELDLIFEIIDPITKEILSPGEWGEIVITTLNRRGMPLIRYRTGDVSRFLDRTCACHSPFRCLDNIRNRQVPGPVLAPGLTLTMPDLDDIFFSLPGVMDFTAELKQMNDITLLKIDLQCIRTPENKNRMNQKIQDLTRKNPMLKQALEKKVVKLAPVTTRPYKFKNTYLGKRMIFDNRTAQGYESPIP